MPYGVLCFLPSYTLLNKLLNRWTDNRMIDKIKEYKEIFSETRVAKNFDQLLKDFYNCINNCSDSTFIFLIEFILIIFIKNCG